MCVSECEGVRLVSVSVGNRPTHSPSHWLTSPLTHTKSHRACERRRKEAVGNQAFKTFSTQLYSTLPRETPIIEVVTNHVHVVSLKSQPL